MTQQLARRDDQRGIQQPSAQPKELTWTDIEALTGYDQPQIALVARTVAQGAPLQELVVFLHACKTLNLDPLLRQAYWIRRKSREQVDGQWRDVYKGTLQVGIDGFRALAERSGAYAGSEPPRFLGQLEITHDNRTITVPERAQVVVWKIVQGHKAAFTGEANWTEFYPGESAQGQMYRKMPRHMLAKDAEAQALRKAFPALLGSVQMAATLGEAAEGELPTVAAPQRIVEEQPHSATPRPTPAANAARHAEIFDANYDDDVADTRPEVQPAPEPESSSEMVTSARDSRWKAWQKATHDAQANDISVPELALPISAEQLESSTATLLDLLAAESAASKGAI